MVSIKSRRGSYIAEAAVVLPIMVIAVITTVLIIMFFYSQVTEQCKLHICLRREAGMAVGKSISLSGVESSAELYTKRLPAGVEVFGKKYLIMQHKGLLEKRGVFSAEDSCYGTDGPCYVRYCNMVKKAGKDRNAEK